MEAAQEPRAWQAPFANGIPASLQQYSGTLQGAYLNSGRMSEGVAQLHALDASASRLMGRRQQLTSDMEGIVTHTLSVVEKDVKAELHSTQSKLAHEVQSLQSRIETEMANIELRVCSRLATAVATVQQTLASTDVCVQQDLKDLGQNLKDCITKLQTGISCTEEDYMASLAQLLIVNAWTTAWPESLRTAQQMQRTGQAPPPQYAPPTLDLMAIRQAIQQASSISGTSAIPSNVAATSTAGNEANPAPT
ncbi:hypothetical protein OC834_006468 [Tilletia horrida]|uniref:Uncharacterized protein n=1 Tax=Tilletia horrida TaxID=155126 RepID=A0AAN6GEK7_9BASI|nr:hypothetical protein OC834_006468 [Tilletia horrida]KAK0537304.1 hypothetical protein OC842_001674 [Tilletia horrida]